MDLVDARTLAHNLMAKHGLIEQGWVFGFDHATSRLGACHHNMGCITISRLMAGAATEEQVTQTMLHEIAHALLPYRDEYGRKIGHGPRWKKLAASIGFTGGRLAPNPYREQLRSRSTVRTTSAKQHQTVPDQPHQMPVVGARVRMASGREGYVRSLGRTRVHIQTDDGQLWNASPAAVTVLDQTLIEPPPETPRAKVGQIIEITSGQRYLRGQKGVVQALGTTRYKVKLASSGRTIFVPFLLGKLVA